MDILINHLWLTLGVWTLVYLSDYYLTLLTGRLYQGVGNQHIFFEQGIRLTPLHKRDRLLSLRARRAWLRAQTAAAGAAPGENAQDAASPLELLGEDR